jgi:biopolymer transport protein ExbD
MRLIAVLIVWLIAFAAVAASNAQHKQINAGLPLVQSQLPQLDDPRAQPHLLVAPCPVEPMNLPDYSERSA